MNLSVNPPTEGAALLPEGPEVFMNGPGNFDEFSCIGFEIWFEKWYEKYSVTHLEKKEKIGQ
jgi:hypothetical protein